METVCISATRDTEPGRARGITGCWTRLLASGDMPGLLRWRADLWTSICYHPNWGRVVYLCPWWKHHEELLPKPTCVIAFMKTAVAVTQIIVTQNLTKTQRVCGTAALYEQVLVWCVELLTNPSPSWGALLDKFDLFLVWVFLSSWSSSFNSVSGLTCPDFC